MVPQDSLLVTLVGLIDLIPVPAEPVKRRRGRCKTYPDQLFLKALVIMIVRQVHTPSGLLAILAQKTAEMQVLRQTLSLTDGRFACRRTWERRLAAIPETLPAQIACLGCFLLELLGLWSKSACAAAIDSTVLTARGGVWHKKDREAGLIRHTSIDTEAQPTFQGHFRHSRSCAYKMTACNSTVRSQRRVRLSVGNSVFQLTKSGLTYRAQSSAQGRLIFMSRPQLTDVTHL